MTLTRRPSPFSELVTLHQATDRLSDDTVLRPLTAGTRSFAVRTAASGSGEA